MDSKEIQQNLVVGAPAIGWWYIRAVLVATILVAVIKLIGKLAAIGLVAEVLQWLGGRLASILTVAEPVVASLRFGLVEFEVQ